MRHAIGIVLITVFVDAHVKGLAAAATTDSASNPGPLKTVVVVGKLVNKLISSAFNTLPLRGAHLDSKILAKFQVIQKKLAKSHGSAHTRPHAANHRSSHTRPLFPVPLALSHLRHSLIISRAEMEGTKIDDRDLKTASGWEDWMAKIDPKTGALLYYNTKTGEQRSTYPVPDEPEVREVDGHPAPEQIHNLTAEGKQYVYDTVLRRWSLLDFPHGPFPPSNFTTPLSTLESLRLIFMRRFSSANEGCQEGYRLAVSLSGGCFLCSH